MKKYKCGYTQGVFDMFHIGHLNLLNNAKQQCEKLIVGVNSDQLVEAYKRKTPVICESERCAIVDNIKAVDQAVVVNTLDKRAAYEAHHFDAIFIGDDWKGNPRWEETQKQMAECGVELVFLPYTSGISSTILRKEEEKSVDEN